MQYLGGKADVGKRIAMACVQRLTPGAMFVDAFCGSLNVVRHVPALYARLAADACLPLVTMWQAALSGWVPPRVVTKETYAQVKMVQDPHDPMTAFVLFGCSFGGKWCGGYAKDRPEQRYAECASNGVIKKARDCAGVRIVCAPFQEWSPGQWPVGTVLYCDPPYAGTTTYKGVEPFPSDDFWWWAEQHARRGVHVLVSEYDAPDGWALVDEQTASQGGRLTPGVKSARVDRLFYRRPDVHH